MFFSSSRRALLILATVPTLAIGVLFAAVVLDSRRDVTEHALLTNTTLANTVEENIRRTLDFYDRSLKGVAEEVTNPETMALPPNVRQRVVFDKAVVVPGIAMLLFVGPDGRVRLRSDEATGLLNSAPITDRAYFIRHRDRNDVGLDISEPITSRADGQPVVILSRRVNLPDGGFGGVVLASINVHFFNELFNAVNLGEGGRISLLRSEGTILARFPVNDALIGQTLHSTPVFRRYLKGESHFLAESAVDGTSIFYLFKSFKQYPLMISVGQSSETVYGDWRRRTVSLGLITLVLMSACLALAWLFLRELNARQRAAQQLRVAERDLRTILDGLPSMVAYWDRQLRIRFANSRYLATFAAGTDETRESYVGLVSGQRLAGPNAHFFERALRGERQEFETPVTDASGARRYMLVSFVPDLGEDDGEVDGVFVQATDITERKAAEDRLFEEKERFRVTLASIGDAVISTDAEGRVTYLNPVAQTMTGWHPVDAVGVDVGEVVPLHDGEGETVVHNPVAQALRDRKIVPPSSRTTLFNRHRVRFDIEDTAAPILDRDGSTIGAVMVLRDVTQARSMALRMAHLAQYDALTGLPNRVLLQDRANQAIARGNRDGTGFALMYLDLDGFKDINDALGHDAGDAVLVQFAQRLSGALRQSDTLSRQGGDEFIVLAPMVPDAEAAHALAGKLVRLAAQPFNVDGRELRVTTSLGIALFPEDGATYDVLSRHADAAMYMAKRGGKNQLRFYTGEIGQEADQVFEREHAAPSPTAP